MDKALKDFIKDNDEIPVTYWQLCYRRFTCASETPYERLRAVFLDAIAASGGQVNLDDELEAVLLFHERINQCFKNNQRSDFHEFCKILIGSEFEKEETIRKLWEAFDGFPQIGEKKSAMIIKNIVLFSEDDIFYNIDREMYKEYLIVPVDRVVRILCRTIYNEPELNFNEINEIANKEFPGNPILLDDLWFWGHFTMQGDEVLSNGNEARIKTDFILTERFIDKYRLIDKINKFTELFRSL